MQTVSGEEFLHWATARGIGVDPRYPASGCLSLLPPTDHARYWVVPDDPASLDGLEESIELLATAGVPLRIDAILSPIGFGFAESLGRYLEVRRRWPDAEMMMGIGNLTELTDADSAAINVLLLGFCQELGIHSVLSADPRNPAAAWCRKRRRAILPHG